MKFSTEHQIEFMTQAFSAQLGQDSACFSIEEAQSLRFDLKSVALLIADRAQHPCGIIHERAIMQHADKSALQVTLPAKRIKYIAGMYPVKAQTHRIDREIAAAQVIFNGRKLDRGQRSGMLIGFRASADQVQERQAVGRNRQIPGCSFECSVAGKLSAQLFEQCLTQFDRVSLDHNVKIVHRTTQHQVTDKSAHEVAGHAHRGRTVRDEADEVLQS
jgi:hypothetical protein